MDGDCITERGMGGREYLVEALVGLLLYTCTANWYCADDE